MKLSQVAKILNSQLQGSDKEFSGFSIDTRSLQTDELFIAISGEQFDGHDFIKQAACKGAVGAIVSQQVESTSLPLIKVTDTKAALWALANYQRQQFNLPMIAVTGSCGKTTTRALLQHVFVQAGQVLASEKSFNNDIGVPLTLLKLTPEYDYAVLEMGTNHPGELAKLTHLVRPHVAIITLVAPVHLEGFGDLDGVACAKSEIFQGLEADGTAIINNDDRYADFWRNMLKNHRVLTFAMEQTADVMARNIELQANGTPRFTLVTPQGEIEINLQLQGLHNIVNALAASAAACVYQIPLTHIKRGLELTQAVDKRLVEFIGKNGVLVIDDSYNANPSSVEAAIRLITQRSKNATLVLGDMLELGEAAERMHHDIGSLASACGIKRLYCYGELAQYSAQGFGDSAKHFTTQAELIQELLANVSTDMLVLVKGSRSMRMDQVVNALKDN